jgi:PAS domain S-box-containing protein
MPLQDLTQEMQRVYKDLPVGLCYLDTDLRFIQINDWLAEINGMPAEEHLGRMIGELIPDVAAGVEVQFRQIIDTGEPIIGGTVEAETSVQPGITRHFQYSCYPVRSDDGEVIGISCVVEDVTVRNEALCESEDRFRDFVEAASDWFWEMDENLRFTYLADSLLEIGGSKPEDLLGKTWQEADRGYEDNEDWRRQLACLKARRVFRDFQYPCVMPDGSIRHYSTSGTPIFDRAGRFKGYRGVGSDITEHKRTKVALQESEERLSSFINNMPNSIYLKDTEGRYVLANDSAMKQYGLPKNRLIGKTVYDLHPKGEADATVKQDREVLKQGVPIETERELTLPNGSKHTVIAVKFPVRGESGEIIGIGGINIDITERKQAEEALRLAQITLDHAGDAIIWIGPDARLQYVNEYGCQILGYSAEDLSRLRIFDIDPEVTEKNWPRAWQRIKTESPYTFEAVHRRRDGSEFPAEFSIFFLKYRDKEFACSFSREITERKRAEEELAALNENLEKRVEERTRALRDSEARLKAILDNSPAAIYLKDLEGRFLVANKAYLNWDNLKLKDIQGKTSYEIFPKKAAEAYVSQDKEMIETRTVVAREVEQPLQGGSTRSIVVTKFPVLSPEGTLVAIGGIDVDITERKRLEDELLRQERMATLGQLTATVSHELRNPLGVIRTSNFILRAGLNGEVPRVKRALERIDRSVIRCDRIID